MVKKFDAPTISIGERYLKRCLVEIMPEIPEVNVGTSSLNIVSQPEVDPNDKEAVKEAQVKKNEEIERMKQFQIEFNRQEVEKREKEATEATLKALWPQWIVERIQDKAIKNVEK